METSSPTNESLPHVNVPFTDTSLHSEVSCLMVRPSSLIFFTFYMTFIVFFVPVCIIILHHAFQQRGSTSPATTWGISDCFTYHLMVMELIGCLGYLLHCCAVFKPNIDLITAGTFLSSFIWNGEIYFHVLLCLDRYLAVVHPIKYRGIKKASKLRIRNICIGCVWLICVAENGLQLFKEQLVIHFFVLVLALLVVSLCSLSILCGLIHPAPGDHMGNGVFVDHSKRKAFYIVGTILVALVLRFSWSFFWVLLVLGGGKIQCVTLSSGVWLSVPSSLVSPLLFLHKTGKNLAVCWVNNKH